MRERSEVASSVRLIASTIRRIVGMPDYATFVEHMKRRHPQCAVPSEREFFDQYVTARYSGGPTRCC
ncbi:MAG TPA: YbdD/YjiX family protein [Gemmatimonadales bacterium]|nr:YbdD/YjiX family protein [Gemmatimonadales bacterium]